MRGARVRDRLCVVGCGRGDVLGGHPDGEVGDRERGVVARGAVDGGAVGGRGRTQVGEDGLVGEVGVRDEELHIGGVEVEDGLRVEEGARGLLLVLLERGEVADGGRGGEGLERHGDGGGGDEGGRR